MAVSGGPQVGEVELRRIAAAVAVAAPHDPQSVRDGAVWAAVTAGAVPGVASTAAFGNCRLVGDIRIDNRDELAGALAPVAEGTGDHALALNAYLTWGEQCAEHLVGEFAFAVWDERMQKLLCVRDRFGVAPLYYSADDSRLVFGNSLDAIRATGVDARLDERVVGDLLTVGYNLDPAATIFARIRALPPAHVLSWSAGGLRLSRYWTLGPSAAPLPLGTHEYVERFRELFDAAVADRARGGSVAAHVSGGLDSSSIAVSLRPALADRGRSVHVHGYKLVYEQLFDSSENDRFARLAADAAGIDLELVAADGFALASALGTDERVLPEPRLVLAQSADYALLRHASERADALFTGYGGDPLLTAPGHVAGRDPARTVARSALSALRAGRLPRVGLRAHLRGRRFEPPGLPQWIDPDFARRTGLADRLAERNAAPRRTSIELLLWPGWLTFFTCGHPSFHGLPIRAEFPLFDVRLVEFVLSTPAAPWRRDKHLLREAMLGRLSEPVRLRPKTPWHVAKPGDDRSNPLHRLAALPEVRRNRLELLEAAPIEQFADSTRALAIAADPLAPLADLRALEQLLPFADWLMRNNARRQALERRTPDG